MVMKSDLELVKHKVDSMGSDMRQLRNMMEMLLSQNASRITTQGDPSQPGPSRPYVPLPPSINHGKSSSIMENRLLPYEDKQELRQRFYALKQGKRIVAEYIVEFDDMRKKCGFKKASENTIAWFLRGLSRKIAKEVELKKHETLDGVYKYALKVERKRAHAKLSSSIPCTTMEQNAKEGISDGKKESPKPNVPPPPPPPPPVSLDMPPPPSSPMNQDVPPPSKHELLPPSPMNKELPPPPSSPTHKLQPHVEEDSGLSNEVSKDVIVCGEKERDKEDGDRIFRVEIEEKGIMLELYGIERKLNPREFCECYSGEKCELNIFKATNCFRLRWENIKRVKMKKISLKSLLTNIFVFVVLFLFLKKAKSYRPIMAFLESITIKDLRTNPF